MTLCFGHTAVASAKGAHQEDVYWYLHFYICAWYQGFCVWQRTEEVEAMEGRNPASPSQLLSPAQSSAQTKLQPLAPLSLSFPQTLCLKVNGFHVEEERICTEDRGERDEHRKKNNKNLDGFFFFFFVLYRLFSPERSPLISENISI